MQLPNRALSPSAEKTFGKVNLGIVLKSDPVGFSEDISSFFVTEGKQRVCKSIVAQDPICHQRF